MKGEYEALVAVEDALRAKWNLLSQVQSLIYISGFIVEHGTYYLVLILDGKSKHVHA